MNGNLNSYFGRKSDKKASNSSNLVNKKKYNKKNSSPESDEEPLSTLAKPNKRKICRVISDEDSPDVFIKRPPSLKLSSIRNPTKLNEPDNIKEIDPIEYFQNFSYKKKRKSDCYVDCKTDKILIKNNMNEKNSSAEQDENLFYLEKNNHKINSTGDISLSCAQDSLSSHMRANTPSNVSNINHIKNLKTEFKNANAHDDVTEINANSNIYKKEGNEKNENRISMCYNKIKNIPTISVEIPFENTNCEKLLIENNKRSLSVSKLSDRFNSKLPSNLRSKYITKTQITKDYEIKDKIVVKNDNLWVDKYKPKSSSDIVGQLGPKSPANKLRMWLSEWANSRKIKKNYFVAKEDGSAFKAVLISGSPGIGKSTTVYLVCRELCFDIMEMNASDQRNKKCLDTILSVSLQNMRLGTAVNSKSVLIMDEVDGMSGNEDRGGIQEIISLIKSTKIPIICICNNRMHQKIRSLSNYCFDLRFYPAKAEDIRSLISRVSFCENISIDTNFINQIIESSHHDIRSILNNLQLFSIYKSCIPNEDKNFPQFSKDCSQNIFEASRRVFSQINSISIQDKSNLFFMDYSLVPLFIHENYLNTQDRKIIDIIKSIDCISQGDLCDNYIKSTNNWSMLPTYGILSAILPSEYVSGAIKGTINFPQILGKTSNINKNKRIIQEFVHHSHLKSSLSKYECVMDFIPYSRARFFTPLTEELTGEKGVQRVVSILNDYNLTREDWDSIYELSQWSNLKFPAIPTKTKSAFTRSINKLDRTLPYSVSNIKKTKFNLFDEDEVEEEDEKPEEGDPMIKILSTPKHTKIKKERKTKTK